MRRLRKASASFLAPLLAIVIWAIVFRPLPTHFGSSIPFTAHHAGEQVVFSPVPGDHLQLLYHFWLMRDMLAGKTPWFHNLYEFNTGDDSACFVPDPGYIPFSLIYAAVAPFFGNAAGWNTAQLAALLTSFCLLFALSRRYVPNRVAALVSTALTICLPYQWIVLATGSPTGFGMAIVPAIALGLDIAIRDDRMRGGIIAGAALLLAYASDLHCFFFGALLVPAWCLVAFCGKPAAEIRSRLLLRNLWPVAVSGLLAAFLALYLRRKYSVTDVADGRGLRDVMANSPGLFAVFGRVGHGADLHFRIGFVLLSVMVVAAVLLLASAVFSRRRKSIASAGENPPDNHTRILVPALLLLGGIMLVLLLGLGTSAPQQGLPLRVMRRVIPPYRMIRQPVKILCLLPTLLAPLLALAWRSTAGIFHHYSRSATWLRAAAVVAALLAVDELAGIIRVGLATLPPPNKAWQAVAQKAHDNSQKPHILVVPIWPGDSAWSSLYEYRAMQSRIRMVNGYSPVRTEDYMNNVFRRYESITQGRLTAGQVAALKDMGVTEILLHEGFSEVVSPFPVLATMQSLQRSPWLDFLERDDGIWAFSLRETAKPDSGEPAGSDDDCLLSAARWFRWPAQDPEDKQDKTDEWKAVLRSPVAERPSLRWLIRTVGDGKLLLQREFLDENSMACGTVVTDEVAMDGGMFFAKVIGTADQTPTVTLKARERLPDGTVVRWLELPPGTLPGAGWAIPSLRMKRTEGEVHVTDLLLAGGRSLLQREVLRLPAAAFFRGGYLELENGKPRGVRFRPGFDQRGEVLYGPNLPLAAGGWGLTIEGEFDPADEEPAIIDVFMGEDRISSGSVGVGAAPLQFVVEDLRPLVLRLIYAARTEIRIDDFILTPLDE